MLFSLSVELFYQGLDHSFVVDEHFQGDSVGPDQNFIKVSQMLSAEVNRYPAISERHVHQVTERSPSVDLHRRGPQTELVEPLLDILVDFKHLQVIVRGLLPRLLVSKSVQGHGLVFQDLVVSK